MTAAAQSAKNEILAPRMYPLVSYGAGTKFSRLELDDPAAWIRRTEMRVVAPPSP